VLFKISPILILPRFRIRWIDAGDTRVVETWNCELKDGKKMEDLQANNVKWLARTRQQAGNDEVYSYAMSPIVGDLTGFMFVDTYPDMATWSAA
jgi:hypothetical protein